MKILGVIVARAGSKGIPGKNLRKINETFDSVLNRSCSKFNKLTDFIISTDGYEIAEFSKSIEPIVPLRPNNLADDVISPMYAVLHGLKFMENEGKKYDAIMMLNQQLHLEHQKILMGQSHY